MDCTHCNTEMIIAPDGKRYECPQCHRGIPVNKGLEQKQMEPIREPIFTILAGLEFGIGFALGSSIVGVVLWGLYYLFFIRNTGTPQP